MGERRYVQLHHVREDWHARPHHREEVNGKGRGPKITAKKAGRYDSYHTIYTTNGVAGVQPSPGIIASCPYSCVVLLQAQNVRT